MSTRNILFALIMSLAFGAATAATPVVTLDHPVEISTDCLILPSSAVGAVSCGPRSVLLTANTTYWIGNQAVTFAEFGRFLASLAGKPRNGALLLTLDQQRVTRIYVADESAAR
jgi:hypothetical protein